MTTPHYHSDFDGEGDILMSDPLDSMVDSPSTDTSSYTSSQQEAPEVDLPTATTTPRGSAAGLHPSPDKATASSRFFTLPREIRNKIYTHLLGIPYAILWPSATLNAHLTPQLLRTCKRIYDEASPLLYNLNVLHFSHPSDANMFLYNHNPLLVRENVSRLRFQVRDKEVKPLWFYWLSSNLSYRSLQHDYPALKQLHIQLRSSFLNAMNGDLIDRYQRWIGDRALRELCHGIDQARLPEGCDVKVLVCTSLSSEDVRTLVDTFQDELGIVKDGDGRRRVINVRTQWQPMHGVHVALEIEGGTERRRIWGP